MTIFIREKKIIFLPLGNQANRTPLMTSVAGVRHNLYGCGGERHHGIRIRACQHDFQFSFFLQFWDKKFASLGLRPRYALDKRNEARGDMVVEPFAPIDSVCRAFEKPKMFKKQKKLGRNRQVNWAKSDFLGSKT